VSTTLAPPPPTPADGGGPWRPGRTPPTGRGGRSPIRRSLVALVVAAAVVASLATTGLLAATGAFRGARSTTTIVRPAASDAPDTSSTSLNAKSVYAAASPSVVQITATGSASTVPDPFGRGSSSSTATGAGFVIDGKGDIVTAAHVIDGSTSVKVTFSDGTTRTAQVLGRDNATDVAVLKADASGLRLHPVALGSSASLDVGDAVVAIGSPFGYAESISSGIVSGVDRTIQAPNGYTVAHAIQTDAALNPGNSGGPILDSSGHVVGIADQIATGGGSSEQSSGVGFAVPIDLVARELRALEAGRTVEHAFLGVSTGESTTTAGALIGAVSAGSPAASAGLRAGDVVTAVDGHQVTGSSDLVAAIAGRNPGDHLALTVRRGGRTLTVTPTLGTQPTARRSDFGG